MPSIRCLKDPSPRLERGRERSRLDAQVMAQVYELVSPILRRRLTAAVVREKTKNGPRRQEPQLLDRRVRA